MEKNISILGSGSWGTAVAKLLYNNGHKISLWTHTKEDAENITNNRENKKYLKGIEIPDGIFISNDFEDVLKHSEIIVMAVPSRAFRETLIKFKKYITKDHTIVSISKGIEENTLLRLSEVIEEICPNTNVAVMAGPSHAEEVSRLIPTTCVAASKDIKIAEYIQNIFMNDYFRVYTNDDIIGVEIGGAIKNVIALAAGISDGLGYGDNSKAALMTRGLVEIKKLGVAMGGKSYTFNGLTGIGDLIVTCTSMHSRNRRAGILLGEGKTLDETLKEIKMVVEGVFNSEAVFELSKKHGIEMPIIESVYNIVFENKNPEKIVSSLMTRNRKNEMDFLNM